MDKQLIPTVKAFMELSRKYEITDVRDAAVKRLTALFPSKRVTEYRHGISPYRSLSDTMVPPEDVSQRPDDPAFLYPSEILDLIRVAWEHQLRAVLPSAACTLFAWEGVTTEYLFEQKLPFDLLKFLLSGREALHRELFTPLRLCFETNCNLPSPLGHPNPMPTQIMPCMAQRNRHFTGLFNATCMIYRFWWITPPWGPPMCQTCLHRIPSRYTTLRIELWQKVPECFGLSEWSQLSNDP
jgi:hypothetical protein